MLVLPKLMLQLLENFPFQNIGISVTPSMVGGVFSGVDYFWKRGDQYASFPVYTMYEGDVVFGVTQILGKYFIVSKTVGEYRYETVYAQLDHIDGNLQKYAIIQGDKDFMVPAKYFLGMSGTAGSGLGLRKLHIELYEKNLRTGERKLIDPYGIFGVSQRKYLQPGLSLAECHHVWITDKPNFVK